MIVHAIVLYEVVDRSGEPHEEQVIGTFVHRARAERQLGISRTLRGNQQMLDGRPCLYIREKLVDAEKG